MLMSARNTTKFKLDPNHPPAVTAEQQQRLEAIAAMPESDIDYSDIPRRMASVQCSRPGDCRAESGHRKDHRCDGAELFADPALSQTNLLATITPW